LPSLLAGIRFLNQEDVGLIAIPCNTSHHWYEQLSAQSVAPILNIAQITVDAIPAKRFTRVAVFATRGTLASGLYGRELQRRCLAQVHLNDTLQDQVDACIRDVKGGEMRGAVRRLKSAAVGAATLGATALVLGCTELSVAAESAKRLELPATDSSHQLAAAAVEFGVRRQWNRIAPSKAGTAGLGAESSNSRPDAASVLLIGRT
jgi:aspartate racemase